MDEMDWVDAWNDLADIVAASGEGQANMPCQLPDRSVVSVEECQEWLQNSVYAGYQVAVEAGRVEQRRGAVATRWRDTDG